MSEVEPREAMEQWAARWSEVSDPVALLGEVFTEFGGRAAIGTSGQMSGVTLIDMAKRSGVPFRVFVVDTLRLHPSTYELWDRLEQRYGIHLERYTPDPAKIERMVARFGEHLFFDSQAKQEYCCDLRKVEPNSRALDTADAWITGLRRDQSRARAHTPRVSVEERGGRLQLKVCPLVDYTDDDIWEYVRANDVPYDPMFDPRADGSRYYSLGCVICTTPVLPGEPPRAGRWRWFNAQQPDDSKECGIHTR